MRFPLLVALVVACGAVTAPAFGQGPGIPQRLKENQRRGVVIDKGPGWLALRLPRENATIWRAVPGPNPRIQVVGTAERSMLAPKQFIRFSATIDSTGKITEPVTKVTFPGGGNPSVIASGLDTGEKPQGGKRSPGLYVINGIIREVEGTTVALSVGKDRFEFTVPEDAELLVDTPTLAVVGKDDEVEIEGTYVQEGQVLFSDLKVTLAKPLAPPESKVKARR